MVAVMLYVFLFAVLNAGLGFALAVGLARWQQNPGGGICMPGLQMPWWGADPLIEQPGEMPAAEPSGIVESPVAEELPQAAEEAFPQEADAQTASEPEATAAESEVLTATKSAYELAIIELQGSAEAYDERLADVDDRLHEGAASPDPVTLESCMDSLRKSAEEILKGQDGLSAKLEETSHEREDFQSFCRNVQDALREQNTQIRQSGEILDALDCKARPEEGQKQLVLETTKLLGANDHLRDVLSDTRSGVASTELAEQAAAAPAVSDRLTDLPNRASMESRLVDFWKKDPHRIRQLSLALVDLDQFGKINERYGHRLGDRILRAVAQVISGIGHEGCSVSRFSGQRFLVMMSDLDLREATSLIERVRQTVEITRFRAQDSAIRVTVSGGVIMAAAQDTLEGLLTRAEATLQEAKRYGRNRSFVHEGKYPTPVVPPNFTLEEREISL